MKLVKRVIDYKAKQERYYLLLTSGKRVTVTLAMNGKYELEVSRG